MITAPPRIAATGRSSLRMIDASCGAQGIATIPKSAYCAEGVGRAPSGTHCQSWATAHDAWKHRSIATRQRIGGLLFDPATALGLKTATDQSQPRTPLCQPAKCPHAYIRARHLPAWQKTAQDATDFIP